MPRLYLTQKPLNGEQLAKYIFRGKLVVFEAFGAMANLVNFTKELIVEHFKSDHPQSAHQQLTCDRFLRIAHDAQEEFRTSRQANDLLLQCLEQSGIDLNTCYRDKLVLRILPPSNSHSGGRHSSTHVHRDTWGSNIYQQINWWAPIYPLHQDNTLAIYPAHWEKPIENNTGTWDFAEVRRNRRETPRHLAGNVPAAPLATSEIDKHNEIRVLIKPGTLLGFSGAHLHGGLTNTTDQTRFSIESRTINYDDIVDGRCAPNADSLGKKQHPQWFRHAIDNTSLADKDIARL